MMNRVCNLLVGLLLFAAIPATAQRSPKLRILGDTAGAPPGCSTTTAINVIKAWFVAFHAADSAGLSRAMAMSLPRGWVFSTGEFTPSDTFVRVETLSGLLRYARSRAPHHERMELTAVHFWGWRGHTLSFMPYYLRAADDLGAKPIPGFGKAVYLCRHGIFKFNLAPRRGQPIR